MSVALLDINVLVALAWPSHVHHDLAHRWFGREAPGGWATCPLTQTGFVRISSNPAIIAEAVSVPGALAALRGFLAAPHHQFWADDLSLDDPRFPAELLVGHRQVSDAYLLALAIAHKGRLATLDRRVAALLSTSSPHQSALTVISEQ